MGWFTFPRIPRGFQTACSTWLSYLGILPSYYYYTFQSKGVNW